MENPAILYHFFIATLVLIGLYLIAGNSLLGRKIIGLNVLQAALLILVVSFLNSATNIVNMTSHMELFSNRPVYISALIVVVWGIYTYWAGQNIAVEVSEKYGSPDESDMTEKDR